MTRRFRQPWMDMPKEPNPGPIERNMQRSMSAYGFKKGDRVQMTEESHARLVGPNASRAKFGNVTGFGIGWTIYVKRDGQKKSHAWDAREWRRIP